MINLPHLNKQEASVLTYFGLDRALTLHPSSGGKIQSVLRPQTNVVRVPEQQLKQLKNLFIMACKQSGLSDSVPILVFGQAAAPAQGPQTAMMGYCAGHHLAGAFNYTISTSIGYGSLLPNID